MVNLLKKILLTGTVTEKYDASSVPPRFRGQIEIQDQSCEDCVSCKEACPVNAITIDEARQLSIDHKACIYCGRCIEHCERRNLLQTGKYQLASLGERLTDGQGSLNRKIRAVLGRSLHIRHVDAGSCNACDFEMAALSNPFYDLQQYGIEFVASPRHADMLMVTGVVTRNLAQALRMTYEAVPAPKLVMAVGACACSGQTFGSSYAIRGQVDRFVPVDIYVPGCPPRPQALLYGLLLALGRIRVTAANPTGVGIRSGL